MTYSHSNNNDDIFLTLSLLFFPPAVCWVPQSLQLFEGIPRDMPACVTEDATRCMTRHLYYNIVVKLDLPDVTRCLPPCATTEYRVDSRRDASVLRKSHVSCFFLYYKTTTYKVFEEYLLYDTNTIIAAIGGSLGLFLGFSCFHLVKSSLDSSKKWRKKLRKKKNNNNLRRKKSVRTQDVQNHL